MKNRRPNRALPPQHDSKKKGGMKSVAAKIKKVTGGQRVTRKANPKLNGY